MDRNAAKPILRANSSIECGQLIGYMNVVLVKDGGFETISVNCNGPAGHRDSCKFVGTDLIITRRAS